jgi:hypothetical protein
LVVVCLLVVGSLVVDLHFLVDLLGNLVVDLHSRVEEDLLGNLVVDRLGNLVVGLHSRVVEDLRGNPVVDLLVGTLLGVLLGTPVRAAEHILELVVVERLFWLA